MAGRDTPATRAARAAGITFSVHDYEHDGRAGSYGLEAVEKLGVDAGRVFKTLVADVDGTLTVCVVPVERRLELARSLRPRRRMTPPSSGVAIIRGLEARPRARLLPSSGIV